MTPRLGRVRAGVGRAALAVGLAAAIALGLGGCRAATTLDRRAVEAAVPGALVPMHPDAVRAVVCPRVPRGAGTAVTCRAEVGGVPVDVRVRQTDDRGAVAVTTDAVLFDVAAARDQLTARLSADVGVATNLSCGDTAVRVVRVGDRFTCEATDPSGRRRTLALTFTDEQGTYSVVVQ